MIVLVGFMGSGKTTVGRRFATSARAIADGIARDRRQVLHPASGWALVAGWRTVPRLIERVFQKLQRDHQ
jgi:ABC-type dipeptide/oligopeptide/nickel transport system ATPase subunit